MQTAKVKYDPATGEMCFSNALIEIKRGNRVARKEWVNLWLYQYDGQILVGDSLRPRERKVPWSPWTDEILAEDWVTVV